MCGITKASGARGSLDPGILRYMCAIRARRKANNLNNGISMICFIMIVGLIAAFIYKDEQGMREQEQTYIEREASLSKQIEEEEQRTKTLNERKKYVTTDQYIEEVARNELGLINPDEILIKAKDE